MARIGVIFDPYAHDPEELVDAARDADSAGIDELWFWEDCFRSSGFAAASAALAATERLHVGIGILPMPLRTAAVTAMECAMLARMFPGRLLPGLGHGVQAWMAQAGVKVASPLTLLREYVPAVRALLAGDEVTAEGRYVTLDAVRLETAPAVVPRVYAAAEGPKTLAVVGEVADGVVLDIGRTPDELAAQIAIVQSSRGELRPADVVAYVIAGFGPGSEEASRASLAERGRSADGGRALWGSPSDVADGVQRIAAAGVDDVVLLPADRAMPLGEFLRLAGEVRALV